MIGDLSSKNYGGQKIVDQYPKIALEKKTPNIFDVEF